MNTFDYEAFFGHEVEKKKNDKSYRVFNSVNRLAKSFPQAHRGKAESDVITVWCSNDYLGMGGNPEVLRVMHHTLDTYGAGSGGTRNISGHNKHAITLPSKECSALSFSDCPFSSAYR